MRRRRTANVEESEVNMTPMLDIVFIMLIFFIVTATFVREFGLDVTSPDSNQEEQDNPAKAILVEIDDRDRVYLNRQLVDVRAVRARVQRELAESPESGVILQTAAKSKAGVAVAVMDQVRQAGAPVSLARRPDQP